MRPRFGAVLTLLAALTVAGFARAEDAQTCEVPAYLLTTDSTLSKVADAIKNARPLNVLVAWENAEGAVDSIITVMIHNARGRRQEGNRCMSPLL